MDFLIVAFLTICIKLSHQTVKDLTKEPGHNQPFGTGRPVYRVEEIYNFPSPESFLKTYFREQKPVKIVNGAASSPAFYLWSDKYFLDLKTQKYQSKLRIENSKKETRDHNSMFSSFKNFLMSYNDTECYMVDMIPNYLAKDVVLPFSLQCADIIKDKMMDSYIWFSSGGTSSLVHIDGVDNFHCVYRGSKDFLLVNPYHNNVMSLIGARLEAFSSLDVDRVDYVKFPSLAQIEYTSAHLDAGDCLYIPYKWVHQVRSTGSNVAVNIWFNHFEVAKTDPSQCNKRFNSSITVDKLFMPGLQKIIENAELMETYLNDELSIVGDRMDFNTFIDTLFPKLKSYKGGLIEHSEVIRRNIDDVWKRLDDNGDGIITLDELYNDLSNIALNECYYLIQDIDNLIQKEKASLKTKEEL